MGHILDSSHRNDRAILQLPKWAYDGQPFRNLVREGLPTTRELTTIKAFSVVIGAVRLGTKLRGLGSRLVSAIACFTSITQP
jgi:hypothetical protein